MNDQVGKIIAVSTSAHKGTRKHNVPLVELKENFGIVGDAHAGPGPRQVSLLALEAITEFRRTGAVVRPGDFAENMTTLGLDLKILALGDRLQIGREVILEISQIGKACHDRCEISRQAGSCIMPTEGLFAKVIRSGEIRAGDQIVIAETELSSMKGNDPDDSFASLGPTPRSR